MTELRSETSENDSASRTQNKSFVTVKDALPHIKAAAKYKPKVVIGNWIPMSL